MKTVNITAMNNMDHEDIKDLARDEKARRRFRLQIIKQFVSWSKKSEQKDTFSIR